MTKLKHLSSLILLAASLLCGPALAAPEVGWWWNAAESGRGFFIESQDNVFFLGGYFYDDDGHAKWLVAGGGNADPYNYTGPLYAETGGQTLFGAYTAPSTPAGVGAVTVAFSDDTHGTIAWPGGVIPIVRYGFGTGTPDFQPFTGWWWNPAESGSGYSVELQGDTIFIIGYMYEADGRPVWYLSAGKMSSPSTYSGPLLQFANGQTMAGPYQPPSGPVTVGTLDVEFIAQDEANFTFSDATASAKAAASADGMRRILAGGHFRTISVVPTFPKCKPSMTTFPTRYDGSFTEVTTFHDTSGGFLDVTGTITITGNLTFTQHLGTFESANKDACGKPVISQQYLVTAGEITVKYDYLSTTLAPGGPVCMQSNSGKTFTIPTDLDPPPAQLQLAVTAYSKYILSLNVAEGMLPLVVTGQCTAAGIVAPLAPETLNDIVIDTGINEGADVYGFHGGGKRTIGDRVSTFHWDFAAVRP